MNVEHWKEKLSALDLERECSELFSEDSCWLCDDLEAWNTVLHPLQLHLTEKKQGVLCLSTQHHETAADFEELDTPYDTTFFTVWLLKKHDCVKELRLTKDCPCFNPVTMPDSVVATSPANLQRILIDGYASFDWAILLDALGPIEQLEEVEVNNLVMSDSLASSLAQLLLSNADFVKVFRLFVISTDCSIGNILMSGISKCEELTELTFNANLSSPGVRDFKTLLRATEKLEKLGLALQSNVGIDPTMEKNHDKNNKEILAAVGDLLKRNTTLTELCYQGHLHLATGILNALETNNALRCLTIDADITDITHPSDVVNEALMSMLARNKGLRSLIFEDFTIQYHIAGPMSQGLQQNTTLECLDLTECMLSFSALQALCNVLGVNRTLCSLKVGYFRFNTAQSKALSADLARMQCYRRLHMRWNHWDVPGLSSALLEPSLCPSELNLDTLLFSDESFSAICKAVASSVHLEELKVHFRQANSTHVKSVSEALRENKSLKCVTLHEDTDSLHSVVTAAQSLSFNKCVTQLEVDCNGIDETSADMLASLLVANESIWKFIVKSSVKLTPACVDTLNKALVQNQFITCSYLYAGFEVDSSFGTLEAALQRNITHLHMAARFVLMKNTGKRCAEAFEHFRSKPQLLGCVMSASDLSKAEARAAEKAADLFVQKNYLFINRVVCRNVECRAGKGMQIDQLPYDCWLAIAKYLKVSDVVEKR